ncbi:MAG TPA: DUF4197 family protein, partial [Hymenobacter sp.]|nr:DUF4197 family protein [Hymenobacter sp.]
MTIKTILTALVALSSATTLHAQDTTDRSRQDSTTRPKTNGGILGKVLDAVTQPAGSGTTLGSLSSSDIASGLKEALRVGITKGADQASVTDGYFKNPLLRIALPPEAQKVAARLRQIGFGPQVD